MSGNSILTSKLKTITFEKSIEEIRNDVGKIIPGRDIEYVVVKRNDSMQKRISDVSRLIDANGGVLLVAKGETISKLVSIVEIAKKDLAGTTSQYNKISLIVEERTVKKKDQVEGINDDTEAEYTKVQERVILSILLIKIDPSIETPVTEGTSWYKQ